MFERLSAIFWPWAKFECKGKELGRWLKKPEGSLALSSWLQRLRTIVDYSMISPEFLSLALTSSYDLGAVTIG